MLGVRGEPKLPSRLDLKLQLVCEPFDAHLAAGIALPFQGRTDSLAPVRPTRVFKDA